MACTCLVLMEKSRDQQSALFLYCVFPPVQFPFILAFSIFSLISGSEEKPFIFILLRLNVISWDCVHCHSLSSSFYVSICPSLCLVVSFVSSLYLSPSFSISLSIIPGFNFLNFLVHVSLSLYINLNIFLLPSFLFFHSSLSQCFFFSLPLVSSNSPLPLLYNGTHYLPGFAPRVSSSPAGR